MAIEYKNIPTSFVARHSKIYPNWEFWFENKPSGNPGQPSMILFLLYPVLLALTGSFLVSLIFLSLFRVTRLGEFSPFGWLLTLGSLLKIYKSSAIFLILTSTAQVIYNF
jgi:hypothetical protein